MPWNPPQATVNATGTIYGPIPPPTVRTGGGDGGESDEANIGEEDQAEIERAMKESEDQSQVTTQMINTTSGNNGANAAANSNHN